MRVVARAEVLAAERALAQAAGQAQVTVPALGQVAVLVAERDLAQAAGQVQVTVSV